MSDSFGRVTEDFGSGPLAAGMARAITRSTEALEAIETLPAAKRRPATVFAALHDLALAGRAPELADAFSAGDGEAAGVAAVDTLTREIGAIVAVTGDRRPVVDQSARATVLAPLVAEAARRAGAVTVGLIDVGRPAALNLIVDRVGVAYNHGQHLGDSASPVQQAATVVGERAVPSTPLPEVVARIGLDRSPLDVTDEADARWLRACVSPDDREQAAQLEAEIALLRTLRPRLVAGDPIDTLPAAIASVPADALPVVMTTWALSSFRPEQRRRFLEQLQVAGRPLMWVSAEGVGVAPEVPTFGDRPASGHSILGIAIINGPDVATEAVGRAWSRGRLLSWTSTGA
ncbi:DUF2332 domain-containing protein [Nakamurella leprariae]|uniref:DUF2332 domain-containing protein n=1 Tax=Nakamurella leprariae TaxID=2803911 RepID=A0A938YAA2_9ACTN|nr:DUF2332 domain-containing protein [Nakamurella leprariae]MBM9468780.1 DUF2332 domain-containing protein [Nakamurella leprariae]